MTKNQLQAELKAKVKPGLKPSHLRKSKSADNLPTPPCPTPLKKSHSQLEIPLTQPTPQQQISQLQDQLKFHTQTSQNYLKSLQLAQAQISELEEKLKNLPQLEQQVLELRVEKIKEFGDYYEQKKALAIELAENIEAGTSEINRLETKLLTTQKKKLELALLNETSPNSHFLTDYWPIILIALLYCGSAWLLSKNTDQ